MEVQEINSTILGALETAAEPWLCPEIEGMRAEHGLTVRAWEPEQLKELCERVCSGNSLQDLAVIFDRSEDEVLSTIKDFGSWLSTVAGPGQTDLDQGDQQLQLFALPTDSNPTAYVHDSLRPHPRKNEGALRAITWHRPALDVIKTYRLRKDNSGAGSELLDSTVAAIAAFARQGRLGDVTRVNPKDETFRRVLCEGYDVLEVYRRDAVHGLAALAGLKDDPNGLANAVRMARPVFQAEATMMERALETGNSIHINRATNFIHSRVAASVSEYALAGPHALSIPQVVGICKAHGLLREADSSIAGKARSLLEEHGLKSEVEFLLRPAIEAVEKGTEQEFLVSLGVES